MANDFPSGGNSTPWWYETPSLVSQTTHLTAFASSTDSNPLDITPSVSSGYFEEDDGSNISEGSYGGHFSGATAHMMNYHKMDSSSLSNSTLTSKGQMKSHQILSSSITGFSENSNVNTESSGTLVEANLTGGSNYTIGDVQHGKMLHHPGPGLGPSGGKHHHREVPVGPIKLDGDHPPSKAFLSNQEKDEVFFTPNSVQNRSDYENTTVVNAEMENQLSHSSSAANQEIVQYMKSQLMQSICPMDLLPHLVRLKLLIDEDIDYLYNPKNREQDKIKRIISASTQDANALERFADCLEADSNHKAHTHLAKRLREAMERKRLYPFKRLSSLRQRGNHTHNQFQQLSHGDTAQPGTLCSSSSIPPKTSPNRIRSRRASTESEDEVKPRVPPKLRRRGISAGVMTNVTHHGTTTTSTLLNQQYGMKTSQSMDPVYPNPDSLDTNRNREPKRSFDKPTRYMYDPTPGNFSSLPRTISQEINSSRGTKPYSSARYNSLVIKMPSSTGMEMTTDGRRSASLSRNASFHSTGEKHIIVSPLNRNPAVLSEETEDDSYLYRKGSVNEGRTAYQNVIIAGEGSSVPMPLPLTRRAHGVIMEDSTSNFPNSERESNNESHSTFPRRMPNRSHSMNIQGDKRVNQHQSLPRNIEWQEMEKRVCLRRGVSLHNPMDMDTKTGGYRQKFSSVGHQTSAESSEEADKVGELTPSFHRSHRRTHSYEPARRAEDMEEVTKWKRSSDQFPDSSVAEGEDHVINQEFSRGASVREDYEVSEERHKMEEHGNIAEGYEMGEDRVDSNQQKIIKKKMQWLQQKIKFKEFSEDIKFDSLTRYGVPREILYSGTLYEKGKQRFVILMTDMVLILKPKRRGGKLGGRFGSQQQFIDWFTDIECKTKMPLMLHLLSIQGKSKRTSNESLCLHYNKGSSLLKISLNAVSKEAKDVWLEHLSDAIMSCTQANAECDVPISHRVGKSEEGDSRTKLALTIIEANNIAFSANVTTKNHYCTVKLGKFKCRTPSVRAKCWPTWNYKCDFFNFELSDMLEIEFYTERVSSPDDFLGFVEINLLSASQKHHNQLGVTEMQLKNQHLPLRDGKGTLTVDFNLQWEASN